MLRCSLEWNEWIVDRLEGPERGDGDGGSAFGSSAGAALSEEK